MLDWLLHIPVRLPAVKFKHLDTYVRLLACHPAPMGSSKAAGKRAHWVRTVCSGEQEQIKIEQIANCKKLRRIPKTTAAWLQHSGMTFKGRTDLEVRTNNE